MMPLNFSGNNFELEGCYPCRIQILFDDGPNQFAHFRLARKAGSVSNSIRCKRVALLCINNAFKLNALINTDIEAEDVTCLEEFNSFRQELVHELQASSEARNQMGPNLDQLQNLPPYVLSSQDGEANEEWGTHELLIAEVPLHICIVEDVCIDICR
jgi:hypothetical protein